MTEFAPDALIFDVDGVLLDVRGSFPEMIRQTVVKGWELHGGSVDSEGYTEAHERVLKRHGAFNDDYTIPWVLLNIAKASGRQKLSEAMPSPEQLYDMIQGPKANVIDWVETNFGSGIGFSEIQAIGWKLYAGDQNNKGLYNKETPLVSTNWKDMPLPVGIYSGRNSIEWTFAQEKLSWRDFPISNTVLYDTGVRKPSPLGIEILSKRMGFKRPVYFGDTASDVQALRAFGPGGSFIAIGDLLPEEKSFPSAQAALEAVFSILPPVVQAN